ncbi:MAG TPA: hypothetical protein VF988_11650 [Verrucomicrobiae bacterium]
MSYKTLEVELVDGRVLPCGAEALPANGRGLLTLLDSGIVPVTTCGELSERWSCFEKLPVDEANAFANDIEQSRASLPPLKSLWD